MNLSKIKWLNILLNVLLIVVLPTFLGALMRIDIEILLATIFIVLGFIVFLEEGLKNWANFK